MNDLINDRYEDATDKLTKLDKILRISGSRFNEMKEEQKAVVYLLMNNPNEWKNVNIIIDNNKIKFLYKNKVEIGFLQKVEGLGKDNTTLRKVREFYRRGGITNNEGFLFELTKEDGHIDKILDNYFHALIKAYLTSPPIHKQREQTMDIVTYIEISVAIVLAYGIAVVSSLWILRRREDGTADEAAEAAREAFRKWFRFAN